MKKLNQARELVLTVRTINSHDNSFWLRICSRITQTCSQIKCDLLLEKCTCDWNKGLWLFFLSFPPCPQGVNSFAVTINFSPLPKKIFLEGEVNNTDATEHKCHRLVLAVFWEQWGKAFTLRPVLGVANTDVGISPRTQSILFSFY